MVGNGRNPTYLAILLLLILAIPFFMHILVGTDSTLTERVMAANGIFWVGYLLFGRRMLRHFGLSRV